MARSKRKLRSSAGLPTLDMRIERNSERQDGGDTVAAERHRERGERESRITWPRFTNRSMALGIGGGIVALVIAVLVAQWPFVSTPASTAQPSGNSAPAAQPARETVPALQATGAAATPTPSAASVVAIAPTATQNPAPTATAPATTAPTTAAPAAAIPANPIPVCPPVAGLQLPQNITCIKHDQDEDDGLITIENTYLSNEPADTVRQFFERTFVQDGWVIQESEYDVEDIAWTYEVAQGLRRIKVDVETTFTTNGPITRIQVDEQ